MAIFLVRSHDECLVQICMNSIYAQLDLYSRDPWHRHLVHVTVKYITKYVIKSYVATTWKRVILVKAMLPDTGSLCWNLDGSIIWADEIYPRHNI